MPYICEKTKSQDINSSELMPGGYLWTTIHTMNGFDLLIAVIDYKRNNVMKVGAVLVKSNQLSKLE